MSMRSILLACLGCLVLTGCGTEANNPLRSSLSAALKQALNRGDQEVLTTEILRARLTPELRARIGRPLMIVELPKLKVAAAVVQVEQNGAYTTWQADDGVGLSTRAGLLTGTRGLGFDLMSADIAGPLAVITGSGSGAATRLHRYLDGENKEVLQSFQCSYVRKDQQVYESCSSKEMNIENQYWLNAQKQIWRSQQWVGTRNGYIRLEN